MAFADVGDIEVALLRKLEAEEVRYAPQLLERANRNLAALIPNLTTRALNDKAFAQLVADVESEMVARVLRAGGSVYTRESEGEYSYVLNQKIASGYLQPLDEEIVRLGGATTWGTVNPVYDRYAQGRR